MVPFTAKGMVQLGPQECLFILRIRGFIGPSEFSEFLTASPAHRFNEARIGMTDKVWKGRRLPVFLAHEEEGNKRGKQNDPCGEFRPFLTDQSGEPFAAHPVSHLVVVLGEDHEAMG